MFTETRYTVKQLARLAGVSVRTLHYYDQIGLLKPGEIGANRYRYYGEQAVLRLQQILFLRELDLSLETIQEILHRPSFDLLQALRQHRQALSERQQRLERLITTVDRTILHLRGEIEMNDQELFQGFDEEKQKEYEEEIRQRYGDTDAYKQSAQRWGSYSAPRKRQILEEGGEGYRMLVEAMPFGPASPQAQAGVARWAEHLRYFYDPTPEILLGLADGYNDDPRFADFFKRYHPELAAFMRQAVQVYVKNLK